MGSGAERLLAALAGGLLGVLILAGVYVASLPPAATPTPFAQLTTPPPTSSAPPTVTPTPDPNATPTPSPVDLLPYLTSEITVVNLAEERLALTVTLLDPDSTDEYEVGTFEVEPLQVTAQSVIAARYRLEFALAGGTSPGTCTIDIQQAEQVQFAVIGSGAVITSSAGEPADPAEMIIASASRCRAGTGS